MTDLISKSALKEKARELIPHYHAAVVMNLFDLIDNLADNMPTIEPKHGKWVERGENDDGTHNIQCSACEAGYKSKGHANSIYTKQRFHFCPNCGADMRERNEE